VVSADFKIYYSFHGLSIAVGADRSEIIAALQARLRHLLPAVEGPFDLNFTFRSTTEEQNWTARPSGEARSIYDMLDGEVLYFAQTDQLFIHYGNRIRILCSPTLGEVRVSLLDSGEESLWRLAHLLFTLPFVELLKRRGRYSLHAAGLCLGDRGLFLPGTSGSGKSTLTLALLRAGFDYMTDDLLFLSRNQMGLEVQAFPEDTDVTDKTVSFFPELKHLFSPSQAPARRKHQVWPAEHYPIRNVRTCSPALLVFPQVSHSGKTVLEAMDRQEAFLELIPNVLLTEAQSSQVHLDVLAELIRRSNCYRLEAGRDFDEIADRLRMLLII
jgi:hypothetical protein